MTQDEHSQANRLGRAWDEFVSGSGGERLEPDLLDAITLACDSLSVPAPAPGLKATIWQHILQPARPDSRTAGPLAKSPNGAVTLDHLAPVAMPRNRRWATVAALWRIGAIGALGGFVAGFGAGIWTRLAMRVSGFLTIDRNQHLLTEADAKVGAITVDGTLFLAFFAAAIGTLGGLLYVAIRRWFPESRAIRAIGYGALLLAVFGFILMDENNSDYHLFGPAWLNVFTFSLTYLVYGAIASLAIEWLESHVPAIAFSRGTSWQTRVSSLLMAIIGTVPLILIPLAVIGARPIAVAIAVVSVLIAALVARTGVVPRTVFASPAIHRAGWAAACLPALIGVYLTTQGIVGILTG
jgi:hypothetical protein